MRRRVGAFYDGGDGTNLVKAATRRRTPYECRPGDTRFFAFGPMRGGLTTLPIVMIVGLIQELMHGQGMDSPERGVRWPWRRL